MKKTMRLFAALGAFFVVAVVIAGCGSSDTPTSSQVAVVAGNPITKQAFNHWMYVAEKGNSVQSGGPVIVPTDPPNFTGCVAQIRAQISEYKTTAAATLKSDCKELFTQLSSQVMDFLIKAYWYQGTAYKENVKVTQAELNTAFKTAQKSTFPTAAEYTAFLAETGETKQDISFRLRVQTVFQKLINKQVPKVTTASEMAYYKSHASQFGTPEERTTQIIETSTKANIEKAEAALKSGQSWATVAKQYSTNAATKSTGGVVKNLQSGQEEAAVNKVIFAAPLNKLEGPVKGNFGYYLVNVTKITKATTVTFAKAQAEIKELLTQQNDTAAESKINTAVKKTWGAETKCAANYSMDDCSGYVAPKTTTTAATTTPAAAATDTTSSAATATATSTATATTASGTTTK